jgi:endo-1,4-beta-mannosidase
MLGAMLWCYGDYSSSLWSRAPLDRAPHERYFGLWREDGAPKPAAKVVSEFSSISIKENGNLGWIDLEPNEFYRQPKENLRRLYRKFNSLNESRVSS